MDYSKALTSPWVNTIMDDEISRVVVGEVVDELALTPARPGGLAALAQRDVLMRMLAASQQMSHEERLVAWIEARENWLASKFEKSESRNTFEAYEASLDMFMCFIGASQLLIRDEKRRAGYRRWRAGQHDQADPERWPFFDDLPTAPWVEPWAVETEHIRQFQVHLRERGLSPATIGQRLAVVSSFFSFVIDEKKRDEFGIESCLYADPTGKAYENPVRARSVKRPKPHGVRAKRWLSDKQVWAMLDNLNRDTVRGARNYALLRTFILTGYRCAEVLRLRWRDIQPNPQHTGEYMVKWEGKGDKEALEAFPASLVRAIEAYLVAAGRWPVTDPTDFIWQPVSKHSWKNLRNVTRELSGAEPISETQANNVLRAALRGVVDDPENYSIHSLRRTHANAFYEETKDLKRTQQRLHHASPQTTLRYLEESETPRDDFSRQLELRFGI